MAKIWQAVEYKVLVRVKQVEEKTKGGIFLPDSTKEREENQTDEGVIVNLGGNCFEDWQPPIPEVGDTVLFSRYAGRPKEIDGVRYRVINDKEIIMVYGEE